MDGDGDGDGPGAGAGAGDGDLEVVDPEARHVVPELNRSADSV